MVFCIGCLGCAMCAVWSALGGAAAIVLRMIYMGALPMSILFIAGIIGWFTLHCHLAVVAGWLAG